MFSNKTAVSFSGHTGEINRSLSLTQQIQQLDRQALLTMAEQARGAAKLNADRVVAQAIVALTEKH